jgi:dihydropteroate synthase
MRKTNLSQVQLMGILNLTPDSFSDGGQLNSIPQFLAKAEQMLIDGATILDIGAESSGPNSVDVSAEEEATRLFPYLKALAKLKSKYDFQISIDTYKSEIAAQALELKADIINDITALRGDKTMAQVLQNSDCKVVLMYSKDKSARTTKKAQTYSDVIETIINFFEERLTYCQKNKIKRERLILDPGMGAFVSALPEYSYEILERLQELKNHFQLPILIGTSLKSMHPFPLADRLIPSITTATLGAVAGADILRIHNVKEHKLALDTLSF